MLHTEQILDIFRRTGAWQEGHFLLSSGLHSPAYLQCALVLQYPDLARQLGDELGRLSKNVGATCVVSPALGGIIIGYEVARFLGVRALFCEREQRKMTLRRDFRVTPRDKALIIEDVITTGKSTRELIQIMRKHGTAVVGIGAIINRGVTDIEQGLPCYCLATIKIPTYSKNQCPLCRDKKIPLIKPGSR
ncbi:MAG: orotate phosphoribosyltransferase [Candidatus Aminicenantes bacterium]|nr:orotate phosphoribosyltransferase [Candidatus Aminicenantes bacterium]MDH5715178.1 orotate phosphoribosyltransferase [Candidatus Aminicenantes bacterium]